MPLADTDFETSYDGIQRGLGVVVAALFSAAFWATLLKLTATLIGQPVGGRLLMIVSAAIAAYLAATLPLVFSAK